MRGAVLLVVCACACTQRPQVPILTHHSISRSGDGFAIAPERFAAELDALARSGCRTISFHEWLDGKPLPPRPVILTFDDGYEDAYTTALPALRARRMVGTFFVVSGWIGADADHRVVREEAGVSRRYLVWPEVEALSVANMEIGSHGEHHRRMSHLPEDEARKEAVESRRELESHLHRPVEVFAYPYGSSRQVLRAVLREAGYRAAVSGSVHGGADRFELFRRGVYAGTQIDQLVSEVAR
jgi:peptidoglycan/xylan/chitin deacetylase (PgdA/CDA1 family)